MLVKVTGESAEIMCQVNKKYRGNFTYEKSKPVLYMRLAKALYGCIQSALLWYDTLVTCLQGMNFKLNEYDPCVANCDINGSQCTITWYVDDLKILHKEKGVVSDIIQKIEERFGKMNVKHDDAHTFVGMDIKFIGDGLVSIMMPEYIKECISTFENAGGKIQGSANNPAKGGLFDVDETEKPLDKTKSEVFHHIVAKLLFVAKQARIDIDLAISFLCTRVAKSNEQDWRKLQRVLTYLKNTIEMLADFYTKPLTGSKFNVMRDVLMGLAPLLIEERVEEKPSDVIKDKINSNPGLPINREPKPKMKVGNSDLVDEPKVPRTYAEVCRNITD